MLVNKLRQGNSARPIDARAEHLEELQRIVSASIDAHRAMLVESLPVLSEVACLLVDTLENGGKLLLCGNGGSAADAQHVAAELVGRFALERQPWPALALTTDSSILTAVGNDWEFADVFARQVRAFGRPGDMLAALSTSGRSENVLRAVNDARKLGMRTIGFSGQGGGPLRDAVDLCFCAPSSATPRIQELHILGWHAVCEIVEVQLTQTDSRVVSLRP